MGRLDETRVHGPARYDVAHPGACCACVCLCVCAHMVGHCARHDDSVLASRAGRSRGGRRDCEPCDGGICLFARCSPCGCTLLAHQWLVRLACLLACWACLVCWFAGVLVCWSTGSLSGWHVIESRLHRGGGRAHEVTIADPRVCVCVWVSVGVAGYQVGPSGQHSE